VTQPRRHGLLELRQCPQRRLFDAGDGAGRGGAQPHPDSHHLVVVERQRRHGRSGIQAVAAGDSTGGVHVVAQDAQALDVVPDGPCGDAEALGRSAPDQSRRTCNSDSSCSSLTDVSNIRSACQPMRNRRFRKRR
jgi:hypothetical protein